MQHLGLKYYHAKSLKEICLGFRFWNSFRGDNPPCTLSIVILPLTVPIFENLLDAVHNIRDTIKVRRAVGGLKQFQAIISYARVGGGGGGENHI